MIRSVTIENIILVKRLHWQLDTGLCVLTGETGAGKSILLDALGFVLGARASGKLVRQGEKAGFVLLEIDTTDNPALLAVLEEAGFPYDAEEGSCLIRRVMHADGKSKAYVNDTPATLTLLKALGDTILEIHGQNDQTGLLDSKTHLSVLDAYAKLGDEVSTVAQYFSSYQSLQKQQEELLRKQEESSRQEDYLTFVVKELSELAPEEGEEERLAEQRKILMQREKMLASMSEVQEYFSGHTSIAGQIAAVQKALIKQNDTEGLFNPIVEALERAALEIEGAESLFEDHINAQDIPEESLDSVEERLFALRGASRKYRVSVEELPKFLEEVEHKLSLIHRGDEMLHEVQGKIKEAKQHYLGAAVALSEKRQQAAEHLAAAVMKELPSLKMEHAVFSVRVEASEDASRWSRTGMDAVAFYIQPNPGSAAAPIHKIASGGELSRLMLALKVVLSDIQSVPTLIFDEVDTGIGGAVADAVGRRLSILGAKHQVIVITHQPQVAAKGNAHYKVEKKVVDGKTESSVFSLSDSQRKEEVARMLSGEHITNEARAAADTLLVTA